MPVLRVFRPKSEGWSSLTCMSASDDAQTDVEASTATLSIPLSCCRPSADQHTDLDAR